VREVTEWQFTCTVNERSDYPGAVVASIDCGDQGELIPEVLVATDDGLWAGSILPDSPNAIDDFCASEPWLTASPQPFERSEENEDEGWGENETLLLDENGAWVWSSMVWGGDEQWDGYSLLPGVGFTDFETGWAGGSEMLVTIHLVQ